MVIKFVILRYDFFGFDSKLIELQNFSQLIDDSSFILVLISFCNLLMDVLVLGSCVMLYSRLSLRFSFMRSEMTWLMGVLGSLRLYTLGVDESTAFMRLPHKVTASSSSSSYASMSVSVVFKLSCNVL